MFPKPTVLRPLLIPLIALAGLQGAAAQQSDTSCAGLLTEQLRRFSEECLSELATYVATQPDMSARILGEKEKFYITVTRTDDGLLAEAVSKFNYPLMKEDAPDILKQLGWAPPENESDNWKKVISRANLGSAGVGQELAKALAAYGLKQGEAMSVTVGPKLTDKPSRS
jgi:hypothetical protein